MNKHMLMAFQGVSSAPKPVLISTGPLEQTLKAEKVVIEGRLNEAGIQLNETMTKLREAQDAIKSLKANATDTQTELATCTNDLAIYKSSGNTEEMKKLKEFNVKMKFVSQGVDSLKVLNEQFFLDAGICYLDVHQIYYSIVGGNATSVECSGFQVSMPIAAVETTDEANSRIPDNFNDYKDELKEFEIVLDKSWGSEERQLLEKFCEKQNDIKEFVAYCSGQSTYKNEPVLYSGCNDISNDEHDGMPAVCRPEMIVFICDHIENGYFN